MANEINASMEKAPPAPAKKRPSSPPVGVVLVTFIAAIAFISNLDWLGKQWYGDGSLIPSICCFEVFTGIESVLGVKSERLASAYAELAHAYSKVPRYRDAIRAEQRAIDMRAELLGPRDPNVLILKAHVGEFMAQKKEYAQADKYLADALKEANENTPPEPVSAAYLFEAQAKSYMMQKRWNEAEQTAEQIVPIDDLLLAKNRNPFDGRELLAEICAKSGRYADAVKWARESLDAKERYLKDSNIALALAHETLGKVYVSAKQQSDAKAEFQKALPLLEAEYGAKSERCQYWRSRYDHLMNESDPFDK
jgi:tetratricopeptide (TPR) repeat protein